MASPRHLILATILLICGLGPSAVGADQGRVAVLESIRIDESVAGDVVVVGGDVTVGREVHVSGHVVAVLGRFIWRRVRGSMAGWCRSTPLPA